MCKSSVGRDRERRHQSVHVAVRCQTSFVSGIERNPSKFLHKFEAETDEGTDEEG